MLRRVLGPLARRWPWLETAIRVQERFGEVHGGYLASAVTLAAFVSLFPILLLATAVVGWLSLRSFDLAGQVISSLGLADEAAKAVRSAVSTATESRRVAGPLGAAGLLWSGLGLVAAVQYAFDSVWQVKGRGWRDKVRGVLWLAGAGVLFLASFGVAALLRLAPGAGVLAFAVAVVVDLVLWVWTLTVLTDVDLPWRAHLPGAVLGTVGFEVLKVVGTVYVPRAVASSSALYGSIGTVFAILAWLFFFGRLAVYAATLNVVRWEEEHGTVTVQVELPKRPDVVPLEATRSGDAAKVVNA
jgi:membrane protein